MIVKIRSDGTVESIKTFRYFQGSHLMHNITLYAPFDNSYSVAINFRLPDGSTYTGIMEYQTQNDGLSSWVYPIHSYLTSIPGRVDTAFTITKEGHVLSTAIACINVEESVGDGDIVVIEDPTTLDELLKIVDDRVEEKINEVGGKTNIAVGDEEPDTDKYDWWFEIN